MRFYDTNALLELTDEVLTEVFAISSVTLEELENIKTARNKTEEVRYKARKVVHLLDENRGRYEVIVYNDEISRILFDVRDSIFSARQMRTKFRYSVKVAPVADLKMRQK